MFRLCHILTVLTVFLRAAQPRGRLVGSTEEPALQGCTSGHTNTPMLAGLSYAVQTKRLLLFRFRRRVFMLGLNHFGVST